MVWPQMNQIVSQQAPNFKLVIKDKPFYLLFLSFFCFVIVRRTAHDKCFDGQIIVKTKSGLKIEVM